MLAILGETREDAFKTIGMSRFSTPHDMDRFDMNDGKKTLASGQSPDHIELLG